MSSLRKLSILLISIVILIIYYVLSKFDFLSNNNNNAIHIASSQKQGQPKIEDAALTTSAPTELEIVQPESDTTATPKQEQFNKNNERNYHQEFFGVENWKQFSISNPNDRFTSFSSSSSTSRRDFEDYFEEERELFKQFLIDHNNNNNHDGDNSILKQNTSFSFCTVPTTTHPGGKSVLTKPATSKKYNMKAELCWAPMKKILASSSKRLKSRRRNGCLGVVKVSTKDPSKPSYCTSTKENNIPISKSEIWTQILQKTVGPLHLRLLLEGPEVVSANVFFDESKCEYWLHFFVASPGFYGINFKFAHDDYWGVNEVSHKTKHNLNAYCFPRSFPMLKCDYFDDDEVSADLEVFSSKQQDHDRSAITPTFERWVQRPTGVSKWAGRFLIANTLQYIPHFSTDEKPTRVIGVDPRAVPPYGVAKLATKDNAKYPLFPIPVSKKLKEDFVDPVVYEYPLEKWKSAEELISEQCSSKNNNNNEQEQRWIFVMGDSQSRSITWSLKNYLQTAEINSKKESSNSSNNTNNTDLSFQLRDKDGKKISKSSDVFLNGKWKVSYMWDSYLDLLMTDDEAKNGQSSNNNNNKLLNATEQERENLKRESLKNAEILVAGLGHHPASWGQWTFQEYFEKSKKIAATLCKMVDEKQKKVFWYGAPSWPKAKLVDNFRGTNQRLAVFNGLMLKHLQDECEVKRSVKLVVAGTTNKNKKKVLYLVDFFGITSPVMKHSKDGSHYDGTVVVATCAHKVFSSLCD